MIVLNEKKYAEERIKTSSVGENVCFTLAILARYYYHLFGYRKKRITELLTDFLKKSYPPYNLGTVKFDETIERYSSEAGKFPLFEIDGIWITEAELEIIDGLSSKMLSRLAFTLLCLAKFFNLRNPNNNNWVSLDAKDVFRLARISCGETERYLRLNKLYIQSLLEVPKKNENLSVRVCYCNNESENRLFISDFRELGYEYLQYRGEKFIKCQECGILIRKDAKNRRYCNSCNGSNHDSLKTICCVDCGKAFDVSPKNTKTKRCPECNSAWKREVDKTKKRNQRNKMSL